MMPPNHDTPLYLLLVGRIAVAYTTDANIARTVAEVFLAFPDIWRDLSQHADPGMVPFLTKLDIVVQPTLTWDEVANGWTASAHWMTLRIEKLSWGAQDPKPAHPTVFTKGRPS